MEKLNKDQWVNQIKKGILELSVLMILNRGDSYGYDIVKKINDHKVFSISQAGIYPILKRLENSGLITYYWIEMEGKPSRKYYKITADGKQLLTERLEEYHKIYQSISTLEKEL